MSEVICFYKCPECCKEYKTREEAEQCSNKEISIKYKVDDIVLVGDIIDETYMAKVIDIRIDGCNEVVYVVDPKNGICTYDLCEEEIMRLLIDGDKVYQEEIEMREMEKDIKENIKKHFRDPIDVSVRFERVFERGRPKMSIVIERNYYS